MRCKGKRELRKLTRTSPKIKIVADHIPIHINTLIIHLPYQLGSCKKLIINSETKESLNLHNAQQHATPLWLVYSWNYATTTRVLPTSKEQSTSAVYSHDSNASQQQCSTICSAQVQLHCPAPVLFPKPHLEDASPWIKLLLCSNPAIVQ